jgi:putative FmdB family regulatory protein
MPTYEYECENGHVFEEFQSIVAEPLSVCPICGGKARRKISGGTGLIFKGSGFYVNDYARKGRGLKEKADRPAESMPAETAPKSDAKVSSSNSTPKGGDSGTS